ncbi:MAG: hypothetical protein ACJ8FC_10610 [Sphingomicrobium sp.]
MTDGNAYYRQRADEELAAAESAGDPAISQIHLELARRYLDLSGEKKGSIPGVLHPEPLLG